MKRSKGDFFDNNNSLWKNKIRAKSFKGVTDRNDKSTGVHVFCVYYI